MMMNINQLPETNWFDEAVEYRTMDQANAISDAVLTGNVTTLFVLMSALYRAAIRRNEMASDIKQDIENMRADDLILAHTDALAMQHFSMQVSL